MGNTPERSNAAPMAHTPEKSMVAPEPAKAELFEHILLPIDGSEGPKRGAEDGLTIADTYGATVHV